MDAGDGAIYTAWANTWVEYTVDLDAGDWFIGLNVTNKGDLGTDWYTQFKVFNSLTSEVILINASDDAVNYGGVDLVIDTSGSYSVVYTWLNDKYQPPLDANIQINSVFFDNKATDPVPEPGTMFLLGTGLFGLAGLKRRKKQS